MADNSLPTALQGNDTEYKLPDTLDQLAPSAPAPAPDTTPVNVFTPQGELVAIHHQDLDGALQNGYKLASDEDYHQYQQEQKYGGLGEQVKAGLEGAAEGATFGLSTAVERANGVNPEDIQGRREVGYGHAIGNVAGLAASTLIPGVGEGNLIAHAGEAAGSAIGLGAEATYSASLKSALAAGQTAAEAKTTAQAAISGVGVISKIGSAATKAAVENALVQGGDEISKSLAGNNAGVDPAVAAQSALANVGLASVLGAGIGGGLGAVNPLWQATVGKKLGGVLGAISDRVGGREGVVPSDVAQAMDQTGVSFSPDVRAAATNEGTIKNMASTLSQSDTTNSGREFQQNLGKAYTDLGNAAASSLGRSAEDLPSLRDYSAAETGKGIGDTLAQEYDAKLAPTVAKFEKVKEQFHDAPLFPDSIADSATQMEPFGSLGGSAPPNQVIPGTASQISQKLGELAQSEGWIGAKNDIENEFNRTLAQVQKLEKLSDISKLGTQVGNNTKSTLPFGVATPLSRAGMLIKNVLRDAEDTLATQTLGKKAPELLGDLMAAREGYKQAAQLKEMLSDRLKTGGSISSFGKTVRAMAADDGEGIARKLSGKNDAAFLQFVQENFPATAEKIKQMHLDQALKAAEAKARPGEALSVSHLMGVLGKMPPELRSFALPEGAEERLGAISKVLGALEDKTHNYSNTARTAEKLMGHLPGTAMGTAALFASHNPLVAMTIGPIMKVLNKDIPDAARLATLKFLGSEQPLEAEGFKHMVDYIHAAQQGNNAAINATKRLFKAGTQVLPQYLVPSDKDRQTLDKRLQELQKEPGGLMNVGGKVAHYLPDHGASLATTATSVTNYLNSKRPTVHQQSPLDRPLKPNAQKLAAYNRTLDIAQQPLMVMKHLRDGRLTTNDVIDMRTMYPAFYQSLAQQVSQEMTEAANKGVPIPYSTKLGLSVLLGQPLDRTMTAASIQAAQPTPPQNQPQTATTPASRPKHSTAGLGKIASMAQTPSQARQAEHSGND